MDSLTEAPPTVWFFYGSLMDPSTLQSVLDLAELPILQPAKLHGHHLKMLGHYPALLDTPPRLTVPGVVFEASEYGRYEDLLAELQAYEGATYKCKVCSVEIVGQEEKKPVRANTFEWTADTTALEVGSFDLKQYQMTSKIEKGLD